MMLRTEGDFVRASNMAQDLTNLVVTYLKFWRKYANGRNNVNIPNDNFGVIFLPMKKEGRLEVGILYTRTDHWQTPEYYDVDDDNYTEGYGSGDANICGYTSHSAEVHCESLISLAFTLLMHTPEDMEKSVIDYVKHEKAKEAEELRLKKIAAMEIELAALKAKAPIATIVEPTRLKRKR